MKKKGQAFGIFAALLGALVVFGFLSGMIKNPFSNTGSIGEGVKENIACMAGETQSLDPKAIDKETNTYLTEAENAYRKVGTKGWTSFTQDTALTGLEVGEKYEFVYGIDAGAEAAFAYGPYKVIDSLPCVYTDETEVQNDALATSLSATFYNDDNNAAAMTTVNTAGQSGWARLKWTSGSNEVFGNPYLETYSSAINDDAKHRPQYPNCLAMNLNSTSADAPEVRVDGVEMNRISCPVLFAGATGMTSYCYEAPVIRDVPSDIMVKFTADSGSVGMDSDSTASLYAGGAYLHTVEGELHWGCATDDGQYVGAVAADTLTLDFT